MDASLRSAQRLLDRWAPTARSTDGFGPTLETLPRPGESPRLVPARTVEGGPVRARRVPGAPEVAFGAFLDGTQQTHVLRHECTVPIVFGTAAAVVRVRRNRRLVTWGRGPLRDGRFYVPRALVSDAFWTQVAGLGAMDTGAHLGPDDQGIAPDGVHPTSLAERALHFVQAKREQLERTLAEDWCRTERSPLYIDGGISGSETVARAPCSVGVVKAHRTLYVGPDDLPVLATLGAGERTTAFRLAVGRRTPVLSWYLRCRHAPGREPTWGLVRVEVAELDAAAVTARADEVSRWVLAETAPLALPDPRWHALAYGIRDCEEFLRAIM